MTAGRVLVIEDEPEIGELLCEVLGMHGWESHRAPDGGSGLEQARQWQPDVVVLDLMLPDVDGFEVCRSLKQENAREAPAVLMLTGLQSPQDRLRGFQAGADRYYTKPFLVPDIVREIESLLSEPDSSELRRARQMDYRSAERARASIESLLVDLARTTPLAPADLDAMGRALASLAEHVRARSQDPLSHHPWQLTVRVFRDRIETAVECVGGLGGPGESVNLLPELGESSMQSRLLGENVLFPDHGSKVVWVKQFFCPSTPNS